MTASQRNGWIKPHQWLIRPITRTEIRSIQNIREPRQTAIAWPKRYYDVDAMAFDSERMETIPSYSANDYIRSNDPINREGAHHYNFDYGLSKKPWFTPRDNDWDEEWQQ